MVRLLPIKEFAVRKQVLLTQSDLQRQTLRLQLATAQHAAAELKKRFAILGLASVVLSGAAALAGLLVAKKKAAEKSGGLVSKVLSGIAFFNQIKSLFKRIKPSDTTEASEP